MHYAKCIHSRMNVLLDIWPTWAALARDLKVPYPTVNSWSQRGIPPRRFREIIEAAKQHDALLTFDHLEQVNLEITGPNQEDAA